MDKNNPAPSGEEVGGRGRGKRPGGEAPHLLVIRFSALGDVAMTVPVLRTLLQDHPQLRLTVVSKPFFKPLFADIPNLNFYEAKVKGRHKGILGLWKLANELNALQIHAVADLHNVLRSNILKLFFRLKGIPVIRINKGRKEKRALTRQNGKVFKPLKTTCQRYADVFEQLGFPTDLSHHRFPHRKALSSKIIEVIGNDDKKRIGIAPFAAYPGKTYPLDLMEDVIIRLNNAHAYKIILFGGGQQETGVLQQIAEKYDNTVNAAGVFAFAEELRLISHLDLMLAMDSGNAHLAAMYGVKTITLWGVTHPFAGFYPFAQPVENALMADREQYPLIPTSVYGNKYPGGYEDAMRSIPPEQVVKKIAKVLEEGV